MPSLTAAFTFVSTALSLLARAAVIPRAPIHWQACAVPRWTVKDLKVAFSNDTFVPGSATFSIISSLDNKTESLRCAVPFNYLGLIDGTPGNKDLHIKLQFNIDTATVTLNQTWSCGNQTASATRYALLLENTGLRTRRNEIES